MKSSFNGLVWLHFENIQKYNALLFYRDFFFNLWLWFCFFLPFSSGAFLLCLSVCLSLSISYANCSSWQRKLQRKTSLYTAETTSRILFVLLGVKNVFTPWPDALDFCVWVWGFRPSEGHQAGEWQLSSSPVEAPGLNVQQDFTQYQPPKIPELRATVPRREKPRGLRLGSSYPAFLPPASPVPNPGTIFRELGSSCPLSYFGWNLPEYILLSLCDVNRGTQSWQGTHFLF